MPVCLGQHFQLTYTAVETLASGSCYDPLVTLMAFWRNPEVATKVIDVSLDQEVSVVADEVGSR